jgi:hypothetical protein
MTGSSKWPLYRGTKELRAVPMTKAEYCVLRGWAVPANEDPAQKGYTVEYQDGGEPNLTDKGFEGYVSWTPADVFENTYQECSSFLDRLRIEQSELYDRMCKLSEFNSGHTFAALERLDQSLLEAQLNTMKAYHSLVTARIARVTEPQHQSVEEQTEGFVHSRKQPEPVA